MVLANFFSFLMLTSFILLGLLESLFSVYLLAMLLVLGRATYDPAQTAYLQGVRRGRAADRERADLRRMECFDGYRRGDRRVRDLAVRRRDRPDDRLGHLPGGCGGDLDPPQGGPDPDEQRGGGAVEMFKDIFAGWGFILRRPEISRIVLAKGMWATGGGAQIFLLIIIGMEADFGDISTGAAGYRGAVHGPRVRQRVRTDSDQAAYDRHQVHALHHRPVSGRAGLLYVGVSQAEWGIWTLVLVFFSHGCSGISWVFSTTLLQRRTDNDWMGRVARTTT